MKLQELLKNIKPIQIIGDAEIEVTGETNRNTTRNTNTRKVLGFPGVCLYLSRLVCSSGTDKPIQSPIPR